MRRAKAVRVLARRTGCSLTAERMNEAIVRYVCVLCVVGVGRKVSGFNGKEARRDKIRSEI